MIDFILILVVVVVVFLLIFKRKPSKGNSTNPKSSKIVQTSTTKRTVKTSKQTILYKNKGVKEFDLKGMSYRRLNPERHGGLYYGYALCEKNPHDKYAVAVYNLDKEMLGYTPKGNKRLSNSISHWNNGKAPAWGSIRYHGYNEAWYGYTQIAVGFSEEQNERLYRFFALKLQNDDLLANKVKSTEKFFLILGNYKEIQSILNEFRNIEELSYSLPVRFISTVSSHLEKEKNWNKLIELSEYNELIDELTGNFKNATLRRIETARNMIE